MNKYESLYIITPELEEEAIKACIEKFSGIVTANGGTINEVNEWGKRRLAYPINDKNDGYYVLVNFKSEGAFTLELERVFGITEGILRSIVIRHVDDKKTKKEA